MDAPGNPILYFDGVCKLCNGTVRWIIRHDKKKTLLFAPLQSASGKRRKQAYFHATGRSLPDSIVLYDDGNYYLKSAAVIRVAEYIGGWFRLWTLMRLIPPQFRDWMYDFIARRRYRWWGRQEACMLPTPEIKGRFLE